MSFRNNQKLINGLSEHFKILSKLCMDAGNLERALAYENASNDCKDVLTGGYGWMLDIQESLNCTLEGTEK